MEVPEQAETHPSTDTAHVTYAYKPSLMGAPLELRLTSEALEWRRGGPSHRIPYGRIRRIRLGFRPMTMQNYRFLTEVWVAEGPKLQIASTSWKSVFEHERLRYERDRGDAPERLVAATARLDQLRAHWVDAQRHLAEVSRPLTDAEVAGIQAYADRYVNLRLDYLNNAVD